MATKTSGNGKEKVETLHVMKFREDELMGVGAKTDNRPTKILAEFHDHVSKTIGRSLGYPANQECNHYLDLYPLLGFHLNNIGDPFTQSNFGSHSKRFELGVLEWFAQLWEIDKDEYWGYVTNGGTESNLQGILLGRELLPDGILYTSKESHYSVFKAGRICRMDCQEVTTLTSGEMDCTNLRSKLLLNKDRAAIINVTIGTTFKGGVDNLDLVIETLKDCGFPPSRFYIHCDAALFGLIISFIHQGPRHTFKKPIGSISVSCHKFLASPMPCGVFMTRKVYVSLVRTNVEYIATFDSTISGSRNGHASVFKWYGLSRKGQEGLCRDVQKCLRNAKYLRNRLKNIGVSSMLNKMSIIAVFERPLDENFTKHWELSCVGSMAHIVVMPHITTQMLDDFIDELVLKRKFWYNEFEKVQPPCLLGDIGAANCACHLHLRRSE